MVQRLVVHLAQPRRRRLDRLAPAVQQQSAQVTLPPGALIGAGKRRQEVVGEGFQASTDRGQLGWCETTQQPAPLCMDREDGSFTPYPSTADLTESY